jgi:hypothetical protein
MKKVFPFLLAIVLISSCDVNTDPIELTATSNINEAISVSIPQTNGSTVAFDEAVDQDLNDIFSNFSDVTNVNINSLSYRYQNVSGNTNAVIEAATIVVNGVTIANLSNVNISQEANASTVFEITDSAILDQLETLFLNNTLAAIAFSGTAVSEEGAVDFEVALTINLTITL